MVDDEPGSPTANAPPISLATIANACSERHMRVLPLHSKSERRCSCRQAAACLNAGAHPRIANWQKAATSDPDTIAAWWRTWPNANVGVLISPQRYLVIDPSRPLPEANDLVVLTLPSDKVFQGVHRALNSPQHWHFSNEDVPHYIDDLTDLVYSYGGLRGPDVSVEKALAANIALQKNISFLDPYTSIVYIASMAKWIAGRQNGTLSSSLGVTIHVNEILELMGRKKHKNGGYKLDQKRDISERFRQLEAFMVNGQHQDPHAKYRRLRGRLLNVTFDEQVDLLGGATPYAFIVKPGDAVWDMVIRGSLPVTDFFVSLARLDTSSGVGRIAYLIGLYVIFQYRVREATFNFDQPWAIKTILEHAPVPIETNAKHYTRFRDKVDAAFDLLRTIGVIANWEYVDSEEQQIPVRGSFRAWLQTRVQLTPPQSVIQRAMIRHANRNEHLTGARTAKRQPRPPK